MTALGAEEIRTRVESDFSRIVDVLNQKIALQSISAKGITADHMKRSAQFVADLLREVGVDTKVVQSHNPDGTPGAWEVIGSKNVSEDAPTVLLYVSCHSSIIHSLFRFFHQKVYAPSVAAITALIVCMRFSASSKTLDCADSNTSSVTSISSSP